jgi:long-chain acyl-CoA synthetase
VLKAAHRFSEIGLRPGDVAGVAIFQAPVALHLAAVFALARIGVVYLMLSADEVASGEAVTLLRSHKARAVLTDMSLPADLGIPLISLDSDWLDPPAPMPRKVPHAAGGNMPWLLARSSGTTGKPKEFCLTHAMEIARHVAKPNESKLAIGERMMTLVDFGFIMGLRAALWCIFDGGVVVSSPKKATANEVFAAIDCYGVTSLLCTPSHLPSLWNGLSGDAPRLPLMRTLRIAGSALPETLSSQARRRLSPNLLIIYGTNESWCVSVATGELLSRHPDTAGYLAPSVELEIVDSEDRPLPPGEIGEVRVRTPGLISGYVDNPKASALQFRNGWFYPRDAGLMSADGLLFIKGRTDEMMNFDGMLVSPHEIENVVLQFPAVKDAAAFGVPSLSRGQVPFVAVVGTSNVDVKELLTHCRARLGRHTPRGVIQVKSLPRNSLGKVLRRELTQTALKRLKDAGRV